MVLNIRQHTYVKLGNLGNNQADDSHTAGALPVIFTRLKINLSKKNVIW